MTPQLETRITADRPFWTSRERLDDSRSISSMNFSRGDFSVARYRRNRRGLGITDPNPAAPMFMAVVILRPIPERTGWRNGRAIEGPSLGTGSLTCSDLRETWTWDLSYPFDSFHAFIPQTALDEVTSELKWPRIERLYCPPTIEHHDKTMFGLAQIILPLLERPNEGTRLFTDHVFATMVSHLVVTYGGICRDDGHLHDISRRGMLTLKQERSVTNRLLDDITDDPSLAELASICGLSRSHFVRAFKHTMGLPPHRWLLKQRVKKAQALLQGTKLSIVEIALDCGFADQSHFSRVFSNFVGMSPRDWRRERAE